MRTAEKRISLLFIRRNTALRYRDCSDCVDINPSRLNNIMDEDSSERVNPRYTFLITVFQLGLIEQMDARQSVKLLPLAV